MHGCSSPVTCKERQAGGGAEHKSAGAAEISIESMTHREFQAPANVWRMSVAPMLDWIDS
jgi:hypothetical protein